MLSLKQEKTLLAQLRIGNSAAVEQWFEHYSPYLLKIATYRLDLKEDAEEIVQETFINCLKQLPLFRGEARLKTWMVSILRHEIADYYRKQYAKRALKTIPLAEVLLSQPVMGASETAKRVRVALGQMTKERRELLLMKYIDKMRVKEISQRWDKTVKAIESELFRARQEFRSLYLQAERELV